MKINNFVLNSDYATLKNDTQGNTISATIPVGTVIDMPTINHVIASNTINVGTINAGVRSRVMSSKYPNEWHLGPVMYTVIAVNIDGIGASTMYLWCFLRRTSANTITLLITSESGTGMPTTTTTEALTVTFNFSTFLSPFA